MSEEVVVLDPKVIAEGANVDWMMTGFAMLESGSVR